MSDFAQFISGGVQAPITIHTASPEALGPWVSTGDLASTTKNIVSITATGGANSSLAVPFVVNSPFTINRVGWCNAVTISGNIDVGVYTAAGVKVFSIGSTAQSGGSAMQSVAVSQTLTPGQYYMAISFSSATATIIGCNTNLGTTFASQAQFVGVVQMAASFPLPTTYVPAVSAGANIPWICLTGRTFL